MSLVVIKSNSSASLDIKGGLRKSTRGVITGAPKLIISPIRHTISIIRNSIKEGRYSVETQDIFTFKGIRIR